MIEPRIYRAAFAPAVIVFVVAMFSFTDRPPALPQGLAADVLFEGDRALDTARRLARGDTDLRAGSPHSRALAGTVERALETRGFETTVDRFEARGRQLANVVARRPGASAREIVVVADRDAPTRADSAGAAMDTGALLELAGTFEGRASRSTVVIASLDGGALGEVGARRLARSLDPGRVDAVVALSNVAAPRARGPVLVPWSNDDRRESIGLMRTAGESLRQETGALPGQEGTAGQLARMAFPLGIGAQGPLRDDGLRALRLSGSGELPRSPATLADVDEERVGDLGRTLLRTVSAVEQGGAPADGPTRYLLTGGRLMPGWALSLLALALVVPALVAAIDGFARARRRRAAVEGWLRWVAAGALALAALVLVARVLALFGVPAEATAAPSPPSAVPLRSGGAAALAGAVVVAAAAWFASRRLVRRALDLGSPAAPGAAAAVTLVLSAAALLLWVLNPVAALLFAPALHLWLIAAVARLRARWASLMLLAGLAAPVAIAVFYLLRLQLDPLAGAWYALLLVAGGHVSIVSALLGCAVVAAFGSAAAIVLARFRERDREPPAVTVRGPATYAGPGSLGGTSSALRR